MFHFLLFCSTLRWNCPCEVGTRLPTFHTDSFNGLVLTTVLCVDGLYHEFRTSECFKIQRLATLHSATHITSIMMRIT